MRVAVDLQRSPKNLSVIYGFIAVAGAAAFAFYLSLLAEDWHFQRQVCTEINRVLVFPSNLKLQQFCRSHLTISPQGLRTQVESLLTAITSQYVSHFDLQTRSAVRKMTSAVQQDNGLRMQWHASGLEVTYVYPQSAAAEAGLRVGDIVTAIPNQKSLTPFLAMQSFGEIKFLRRGVRQKEVLRKRSYRANTQESIGVQQGVLTLRTPDFHASSWSFDSYLAQIRQRLLVDRPQKVVLDLRDNRGGTAEIAYGLISQFMCDGQFLGTFETKHALPQTVLTTADLAGAESMRKFYEQLGTLRIFAESNKECYRGPLEVWVNGGTLSFAEILAISLSFRPETVVLGSPTSGTSSLGLWIAQFAYGYPYYLVVPFARFRDPAGQTYEGEVFHPTGPIAQIR